MKKLFVFFLFCLCISVIQAQTLSREISFKSIGKATISGQTTYTDDGSYGTEYYVGTHVLSVFRLYSGLAPSGDTYIQLSDADSFVVSQVQVDYSVRNYPNNPPNVIINATDQNYSSNSEAWENNASFTQLSSVIGNGTITLSSIYNTNPFNTIKGWLEAKKKVYFGARSSNESYLDQLMSKITVTVTYTRKFNLSVQLNQVIGDSSAVHVNGKTVYSGFVNTVADVFGFPENASVTIAAVQSLTTGQGTFGLTNMVRNSTVISTSTDIFPITATTNVTVNYRKSVNGTFATKADYIHQGQSITNEDISGSTIQMYEGTTLLKDIATTTSVASLAPANASLKFTTVYGTSGQQNNYKSYSDVNIKHQSWNIAFADYTLSKSVTTNQTDAVNLTAWYKQLQPATVQISLDGFAQSTSGIQFKDPWRFIGGGQPGNWDSYSAPFTPGTGDYASYGGVFLGVNYDQTFPNNAHYRAKTDLVKTIDGSNSKFISWSTSSATAYSPLTTETPAMFNAAGATFTANYKGNLRTSAPALGDSKNQRRVQISGYKWIMSYESMGEV